MDEQTEAAAAAAAKPPAAPNNERLEEPVETHPTARAQSRGWAPPKRGLWVSVLIVFFAVSGALLVLWAWRLPPFSRALQTTDNANVRGQTTVIAPQVSGYVREVLVQDYQAVKAGEVLVRIDDRVYVQRVEQAKAGVQTQGANLSNFAQTQRSSAACPATLAALDRWVWAKFERFAPCVCTPALACSTRCT